MCFVIAAAAVWILGIETRGLALETLVSEAVETDARGVLSPVRD
jgi:putative MFS transporter